MIGIATLGAGHAPVALLQHRLQPAGLRPGFGLRTTMRAMAGRRAPPCEGR